MEGRKLRKGKERRNKEIQDQIGCSLWMNLFEVESHLTSSATTGASRTAASVVVE